MSLTYLSSSGLRGQLAVDQQVRALEVGGLLGELIDRVTAVAQDALVAVDVGDGGATGRRVHERGVVSHQPEVTVFDVDLLEIERLDRVFGHRHLVGLAGAVVGNR